MKLSERLDKIISKSKSNQKGRSFAQALFSPIGAFSYEYLIKLKILRGTGGFVESVIKSLESFVLSADAIRKRTKRI